MALTTINSDGVKDDSIVNADIKSDAAIAGSKIAPDFGSQNIVTTGQVQATAQTPAYFKRAVTGTSPVQVLIGNNTRTWALEAHSTKFSINDHTAVNVPRLTIDDSGHIGIGVTPSAWPTNGDSRALQIGSGFAAYGRGSGDEDRGAIAVNYYNDGTNEKYIADGHSNRIYMNDGNIDFQYAASASAGDNLSFTSGIRMLADGKVGIGVTTPGDYYSPELVVAASNGGGITIKTANNHVGHLMFADGSTGSDRYAGYIGYNHNTEMLLLRGDGAGGKGLNIESDGDVALTHGNLVVANGKGIDFSATTDSSGMSQTDQSELLDDYEEGEYIPSVSANLTLNTGYHWWSYVKIGRQVTIKGLLLPSAISGTDAIALGLPFTAANLRQTANAGPGATMWNQVTGATAGVASYIQNSGTELRFYIMTEGTGGWARLANNDISTSTEIYVTHTYFAA